ncbi:hypothetical protein BU16DRAFT_354995 [Lophium mytilinum]|uniref:D-arabinono-1,4-lactone oxidase n=1 Tax=Lophium mytilinum TaxID=390894 RepID=A0A6A6QYR6_9PEZI|nr:hypothetical protein BU16DRAFT_354995 [Lophium mytilinum]
MDLTPVSPVSMASRMAIELEKLDTTVPFRASQTYVHHTWARTFHSRPELYIRPQTLPEIQKIVTLARRMRRRIVVVGCAHSPSDLTCTSAWMVNLDDFASVLKVDKTKKTLLVQAGMRLHNLNLNAKKHGLTMRNLGSIDEQSIAGAIATATHGSSTRHGLLAQSVKSLRIVMANGQSVKCSKEQNEEIFRAALVSLGALGVVVEVEFEMIDACDIEWVQTILPTSTILRDWEQDLWTQKEYTRVWWMPYMKRAIVWRAEKTTKPPRAPAYNWYGGGVGYHTYHIMLWASQYVPRLLPWVEWFVFGMQYGFKDGFTISAVEELRTGLLMNCLYSQFVNEWALPLHKGPEALTRLTDWLHGDQEGSDIPFSPKGLWVHSPIEVRVSDTSSADPRPYLDNTIKDGPTLYLNATLYRPYGQDPPCLARYYEAFEWLMREMGGRPHWAKNFTSQISHEVLDSMYGEDLQEYLRIRNEVDPEGMFVGEWHRRTILPPKSVFPALALEEKEVIRRPHTGGGGGIDWVGEQARWWDGGIDMSSSGRSESEESFDLMHGAEAEASVLLESLREDMEDDETEGLLGRTHGNPVDGWSGTRVFDKM